MVIKMMDLPDPPFNNDMDANIKAVSEWSYYDNWQAKDRAHSRILDDKVVVNIAHESYYVNENELGYHARIYNASVYITEYVMRDGKKFLVKEGIIFHGDLSKRRIKFLANIAKRSNGKYTITIRWENNELAYFMKNQRKIDRE